MRELMFRAWQSSHKKMTYRVNLYQMAGYKVVRAQLDNGPVMLTVGVHCIVMEATGNKDKHGRYIYEGDIVRTQPFSNRPISSRAKHRQHIGVVEYCPPADNNYTETQWRINIKDEKGFGCCNGSPFFNCEVIGNIYENPELTQA